MNSQAHWLSGMLAVTHLVIGLSELLRIGPRFVPPSWQVLYMFLPDRLEWVYAALWTLTGIIALFGMRWPWALRIGFRMSAFLFLTWGLSGIPAYTMGLGGNIQGAFANVFIAGCAWVLSHYVSIGVRADRIDDQVRRLAEQVHQADSHAQ